MYLMLRWQFSHLNGRKLDHRQLWASLFSAWLLTYIANMFILMSLYDFTLLPAQFCCTVICTRKVESRVQIADRCAPWKISNGSILNDSDSDNLCSSPECHVMSKGLSISKNTAAVDILLLKFRVTSSASPVHWSVVLWSARNPNWLAFSKFFPHCVFRLFLKSDPQRVYT
jgi:hypothetical protein